MNTLPRLPAGWIVNSLGHNPDDQKWTCCLMQRHTRRTASTQNQKFVTAFEAVSFCLQRITEERL